MLGLGGNADRQSARSSVKWKKEMLIAVECFQLLRETRRSVLILSSLSTVSTFLCQVVASFCAEMWTLITHCMSHLNANTKNLSFVLEREREKRAGNSESAHTVYWFKLFMSREIHLWKVPRVSEGFARVGLMLPSHISSCCGTIIQQLCSSAVNNLNFTSRQHYGWVQWWPWWWVEIPQVSWKI